MQFPSIHVRLRNCLSNPSFPTWGRYNGNHNALLEETQKMLSLKDARLSFSLAVGNNWVQSEPSGTCGRHSSAHTASMTQTAAGWILTRNSRLPLKASSFFMPLGRCPLTRIDGQAASGTTPPFSQHGARMTKSVRRTSKSAQVSEQFYGSWCCAGDLDLKKDNTKWWTQIQMERWL